MLFVVVATTGADLRPHVERAFPNEHIKIGDASWIVSVPGTPTSKEAWEKIGKDQPPALTGIVFPLSGYFGRASSDIWEWIAVRRNQES